MATDLEAARALVVDVGRAIERGEETGTRPAMAKLFAADACTRVMAGCGFTMEYAAQRYFRDARFLLIGGGTSEILKNAIGAALVE